MNFIQKSLRFQQKTSSRMILVQTCSMKEEIVMCKISGNWAEQGRWKCFFRSPSNPYSCGKVAQVVEAVRARQGIGAAVLLPNPDHTLIILCVDLHLHNYCISLTHNMLFLTCRDQSLWSWPHFKRSVFYYSLYHTQTISGTQIACAGGGR